MSKATEYKRELEETKRLLKIHEDETKIKDLVIIGQKDIIALRDSKITALTERLQDLGSKGDII